VPLNPEEWDLYANNLYFDPLTFANAPSFEGLGRMLSIAFFNYPQFFTSLEDVAQLNETLVLCANAMELTWYFSSLASDYSRSFPAHKERYWGHLLALGLMFSNRHGRGRRSSSGETTESSMVLLNLGDNFRTASYKHKLRQPRSLSQVSFGRPTAWRDTQFIGTIVEASNVDVRDFEWDEPSRPDDWVGDDRPKYADPADAIDLDSFFEELDRLTENDLFGFLDK